MAGVIGEAHDEGVQQDQGKDELIEDGVLDDHNGKFSNLGAGL